LGYVLRLLQLRRWWWLHLLVLAAILVQLRLGLWQWHRATSPTGGIQNYAYAFQWPLFAVFTAILWVRTLREEAQRSAGQPVARDTRRPMPDEPADIAERDGVRIGITTELPPVDEDDAEVAAYNAFLARLNERTRTGR
jgi:DNA-binding transcriptional regulator of glucitol operon